MLCVFDSQEVNQRWCCRNIGLQLVSFTGISLVNIAAAVFPRADIVLSAILIIYNRENASNYRISQ